MTFAQEVQSWHDFYITAGAAAATLAGLLFVGLSLHILVVVTHADVRALARVTLTDFFVIVIIALAVLVPTNSTTNLAIWLLSAGGVSILVMLRPALEGFRKRARTLGLRVLIARFGLSALGFVAMAVIGLIFATGDYQDGFNSLVIVVGLLLVLAVRNTWDLLVTVADKSTGPGGP